MDSYSPSPSSPASTRHCFSPKPPSPVPAADPKEIVGDSSKIEVSNEGQGVKYQRRSAITWTTEGESLADGYSWIKYGQKMILNSVSPRNYYRCVHRVRTDCRAIKKVEKLSHDPPRYRTVYAGKHTCKKPPKAPQITPQFDLSPKSDPSSCIDFGESSIRPPSPETILPDELDLSYATDSGSIYDPVQTPVGFDSNTMFGLFGEMSNDNMLRQIKVESTGRIMDEIKDYYSIFFLIPEDYEFEEDTIIQLWIAGEFVIDEHTGQDCFRCLLNGGYISHSGTNFVTKKDRYRINITKLKTLLGDGEDDNASFYLKWENGCHDNHLTDFTQVQHVSLVCDDMDATIFQTLEHLNGLKTLLFLHKFGNKVTQIPDQLFQRCKKLQALDLSRTHIKKLPSSVGCLTHLRYLDLSWTLIEWLPDMICSLAELQTLKLRGCSKLHGLPTQLKRLIKLRHLDVDVLRQLATLPKGIGALVNLRTLPAFLVGVQEGCKIQELKDLNNLSGDFCIAMLENVGNEDEAMIAGLDHKQYLKKLELRWTASQVTRTNNNSNNCYDVLKCLQPCSSLTELRIFCYEGSTFPSWVGGPMLDQLVSITFFKCEHVIELPLVEQLPCLKHLELVKMNGVKRIERRGKPEDAAFFRLEKLEIDGMQSLEAWIWVKTNEGDYNSLVELTVNDCPDLQEFSVLSCLSSIKHLEVRECFKLESLSETKFPDSLEDLVVEDCPGIKKKCLQQGGEDWYKVRHVSNIRICTEEEDDDYNDDSDVSDEAVSEDRYILP